MKKNKKFKIFNEIMNDAFWLSYILEIKRSITDYNQKEILSSFLIFYSSIFVEETIKAAQDKEDENLIKKSLRVIKELATGAAGSLIASGILSLLGTLNIG